MAFIGSVFVFCFWLAVILGGIALWKYNALQRLAQEVKEKSSNVAVAISKKLSQINQLIDVVKNYQEGEQFMQLKISQDNTAATMVAAYQQGGTLLASLQGMAERFPNLKANEQYNRLGTSIQACEAEIQNYRMVYNSAVKNYNTECLAIPAVFVARFMGFSSAPYLEFDISGAQDPNALKAFKTDDGERLQQLLSSAGSGIAGATRNIASGAGQAGKLLAAKIRDRSAAKFFYRVAGGVPKGPVSLEDLRQLIAQGAIGGEAEVAELGAGEWRPIGSLPREFERNSA